MSEKFRVLVVAPLIAALCQVGSISQAPASTGDARVSVKQSLAGKLGVIDYGEARTWEKTPLIRVAPGCPGCNEDWDIFRGAERHEKAPLIRVAPTCGSCNEEPWDIFRGG